MVNNAIHNSLACIISYIFSFIQDLLNLIFIAQIDQASLASIYLANMLNGMVALGVYKGLNSASESLVA